MDIYLFYPDEYQRLYNCNTYSVEDVPLEKRVHMGIGVSLIVLFAIYEVIYIPCVIVIYRKHLDQTCYKIMFAIGIMDIICLFINGLLTGIFSIMGVVFCSHPYFIYVSGSAALSE